MCYSILEQLQTSIAKDTLVHDANASALQAEKMELEQKLSDLAKNNASSIQDAGYALAKLKEEQSENSAMLVQLEKRLADDQEDERLSKKGEHKRLQEVLEKKSMEEKEYYAALWIQLRWKAYLKRKALKQSSKGKKGKKGKKAKKKWSHVEE